VHEGVAWFSFNGSTPSAVDGGCWRALPGVAAGPAAVPIQEIPIPTNDASVIPKPQPSDDRSGLDEFPMNGIPHHEVVELVTRHHGIVVHSEEDRRAGDEWKSYRYFVRRDA
jgi:hypothetical protein